MVPVGNRPILEHVLTLLTRHGFTEALLTLHHMPRTIRDHVGDGGAYGLKVKCYVEDVPLGTAGSVKNVEADLDGTFIVISGDVLTDFDLTALLDFHRRRGAALTIGLTSVDSPLEYGVVVCDRDGRVTRFVEKPSWGEVISDQVNTGIYVIEPEVLRLIEAGRVSDFSRHLFPALMEAGMPLFGYHGDGYWCDVGNLSQYLQAHVDVLEGRTGLEIGGSELSEKVWVGSGVDIAPGVELVGPLLIGAGSYLGLGSRLEGPTVLGRDVVIGGQASVKRSVIGDHSFVGRLAEVRGAILGRSVRLHNRCSVFDKAVLADEVRVGEETTIKPGIKVWPGRSVPPETVLGDSLVWGQGWGYGVFGEAGVTGTVNVDLRPELVARLGAVFGASLPDGATVVVGADAAAAVRLLREALASGLGLSGCTVLGVGELPATAVRYAIAATGAAGGVHLGLTGGDRLGLTGGDRLGLTGGDRLGLAGGDHLGLDHGDGCCRIRFLDSDGSDLGRKVTRRLERSLGDEDFRRAAPDHLGVIRFLPGVGEAYLAHLTERGRGLARKGLIVAGAYRHPWPGARAGELWRALDVAHLAVEPFAPSSAAGEKPAWRGDLYRQVRETGAAFAFEVGPSGENLTLIDNLGRPLTPAQTWLVLSSVAIVRDGTPIVVPSDLPRAVARGLTALGARPVPCRSSRAEARLRMREVEKDAGPSLFRQSEMVGDALLAVVGLLDYLVDTEETVAEMVDRSPLGEWVHLRVACSWDVKGRVMRLLQEEEAAGATGRRAKESEIPPRGDTEESEIPRRGDTEDPEGPEGLRVETGRGQVLVLPDADRPAFHVYSEAASMEAAEELAGAFAQRVRKLAGLEGDAGGDTGIPYLRGQ
jgi:mannose-1-phosphate guanylyltransferase/phosphomannomutase